MAESFRTVRKNTIIIAEEIGEEHYGFRPSPESRSIGQTLVHITNALKLPEQIHRTLRLKTLEGFDFMGFFGPLMADEAAPHTKAEILQRLKDGGNNFAEWLGTLSEDFLAERVASPIPGERDKTRFEMLLGVKEHEMHHRAQLMMMQRMVGLVPHLTRQMNERIAAMMAQQQASASHK